MLNPGTFTIENIETSEHRTFRIEEQPLTATFAPGRLVLSLLVGQSNHHDYRPFAFVAGDRVTVWKSKRSESEQPSDWERYAKMLQRLAESLGNSFVPINSRYRILEAIPCKRCGELLTVPASIRRGIGPVCAGRE